MLDVRIERDRMSQRKTIPPRRKFDLASARARPRMHRARGCAGVQYTCIQIRVLTGTAFVGDLDVFLQPGAGIALEGFRAGVELALPLLLTDLDHRLQQ